MAHRAAKSGFAKEAQDKINSRYNAEQAAAAMDYIADVLEDPSIRVPSGDADEVHDKLKDGLILAKLGNYVKKGSIKIPAKAPGLAFKQMELIGQFLKTLEGKVETTSLFQTVDLYEKGNMSQVILCIEALGSEMLNDPEKKGYGVHKSKGQKKEWTQEQLNAGKGIIGLQMGTNKGASQAGQNFGKSRSIVD